ncbi:glycosyltransferase family 2 protein [Paludibacterium purpuratum]|uniref:Glycosyl transferase family 2 n=1 Tax=Paludibacterium purpuratum TaxID=1144873 RepID=A0A4R7B3W8_9NEIS|nr:glycosyltransferase family 2 protein [Paludibacterium purpuratum]TDR76720.1 glycosyl transferase family 2 [Paludibacterium purpuratum]
MHTGRPCITVITVVRNAENSIEKCIESVISQNIKNIEYIIIDGQSTDNTLNIIERYKSNITHLISEPDNGLYDAMNKGLSLATGEFIHFLNADDRYFNEKVLSFFIPQLKSSTISYGQMLYVEVDGKTQKQGKPFNWKRELQGSRVPQMALFAPLECYQAVGFFDTSLRIAADYDMLLRLAQKFHVDFIPAPVSIMHAGGISYQRPDLAFKESLIVSRRYGRSYLGSLGDFFLKHLKWFIFKKTTNFMKFMKS